jgi:hypothetical protein
MNRTLVLIIVQILTIAMVYKPLFHCIYTADPEPSVQEQALALVRNLVDGCINSVEYVFAEDGILLDAIGRQLQSASKAEIGIQVRILL